MTKGFVVWFTGLSGAGKSTIASALKEELERRGRHVELLDGDEVRTHLSKGLGFSKEDRDTNIRRIGYVARLVARSGGVAITAAISPYREVRDEVRAATPGFVEVFARCPLDTLVERDVKGLYKKAIAGEIANFTGVSDPYEEPLHPEVVCDTSRETLEQSLSKVIDALERLGHLDRPVGESLPEGEELDVLRAEARTLPRLEVGQRELSDLFMLASGALAPLDSFMGQEDYDSVVADGRLASEHPFTIPIVLRADAAPRAERIALFIGDQPVGILDVASAFATSHENEAHSVYGTDDDAHPGVRVLKDSGRWALGGQVTALARPTSGFPEYDLTPIRVRAVKAEREWKTMVGFQTRNPAWMRYAGPKEAVFHAIVRRNYGCTHFIVGRDHAGVGSYYDTYAAHRIFDQYAPGELGIEVLRFEHTFYCSACGGMASTRTCPHPADLHRTLSGTAVRKLLAEGKDLPEEFTRPEVARVLLDAAKEEATA